MRIIQIDMKIIWNDSKKGAIYFDNVLNYVILR